MLEQQPLGGGALQVMRVESTDRHKVSIIGIAIPGHLLREVKVALHAMGVREALAMPQGGRSARRARGEGAVMLSCRGHRSMAPCSWRLDQRMA